MSETTRCPKHGGGNPRCARCAEQAAAFHVTPKSPTELARENREEARCDPEHGECAKCSKPLSSAMCKCACHAPAQGRQTEVDRARWEYRDAFESGWFGKVAGAIERLIPLERADAVRKAVGGMHAANCECGVTTSGGGSPSDVDPRCLAARKAAVEKNNA